MSHKLIGTDKNGKVTVNREMRNNFAQAKGWAKNYANCEYHKGESFTVLSSEGKPIVTYHNTRK